MFHVLDTRDLERSLLKLLLTQPMTARMYFARVKGERLANKYRKFIFECAKRYFESSKSLLTVHLFDFELKGMIPKVDQDEFMTEWNLIHGMKVDETPVAIFESLEKAYLANDLSDVIEESVDALEKGDVESAISTLKKKSLMLGTRRNEKPVVLATDYEEEKKLVEDKQLNPTKYLGIHSGFYKIDSLTGGFFPSELTMIAAITGVGKSTFMKMLEFNIIRKGKGVLHITNEESLEQVRRKFQALFTDIDYMNFKKGKISASDMENWELRLSELRGNEYGRIYIKELPPSHTIIDVERAYLELEHQGAKIDIIFIDYLDHMKPIDRAYSETDEQGKAAMDAKGLSLALSKPVVIATQAATEVEKKQEKGKKMGKLDVYGSKRKIHESNMFIGINQRHRDTSQSGRKDWAQDIFWTIEVLKNRDGPPFYFEAKQIVATGKVVSVMTAADEALAFADEEVAKEIRRKAITVIRIPVTELPEKSFTNPIESCDEV